LSFLKMFAIISLIGLTVFWLLTFLATPFPTEPALMEWLSPVIAWFFLMGLFTGTSAILSLTLIILLASRIDAQEKFMKRMEAKQEIPKPPELKTE